MEGSVSREDFAAASLEDCNRLLEEASRVHASLGMLTEIKNRWPDLPVADEASAILDEYAARAEQPWVEEGQSEQLRESRLLAQSYEAAARVRTGLTKVQRAIYAQVAMSHYAIVARDTKEESESSAARGQIRDLQPLAEKMPTIRRK